MTDAITYRLARPADAELLAAFAARTFVDTFGHLYPPEDLQTYLVKSYGEGVQREELSDTSIKCWLALAGDRIVGYAMAGPCELAGSEDPRDLELYRLYVDRDLKGKGVARALMDKVLMWARLSAAPGLWLSVWENNERAQRFYRAYGFEHVGEHKFMVGRVADRDFIWKLDLGGQ